jgi:maltooligosyltrehalose synthase
MSGPAAEHAVAFARHRGGQAVLVVAARLTSTLCGGLDDRWNPGLWEGTSASLDSDQSVLGRTRRWRSWLTGREVEVAATEAPSLDLVRAFDSACTLPFAVLVPVEGGPAS